MLTRVDVWIANKIRWNQWVLTNETKLQWNEEEHEKVTKKVNQDYAKCSKQLYWKWWMSLFFCYAFTFDWKGQKKMTIIKKRKSFWKRKIFFSSFPHLSCFVLTFENTFFSYSALFHLVFTMKWMLRQDWYLKRLKGFCRVKRLKWQELLYSETIKASGCW